MSWTRSWTWLFVHPTCVCWSRQHGLHGLELGWAGAGLELGLAWAGLGCRWNWIDTSQSLERGPLPLDPCVLK